MLSVLHSEDDEASLSPTPDLDELPLLASAHRAVDGPIELRVDPLARAAPTSVQLTVFRLVQEGLTNVRKHAPGAPVLVCIGVDGDDIVVTVENEASEGGAHGGVRGFGLDGMRERVALFGGRFAAEPRAGGGFCVRAVLPEVTA
jgi:signal transduction histidine kinase